jgi:hypothetical protein
VSGSGLPFRSGSFRWDPTYWDPAVLSQVLDLWLRGARFGGPFFPPPEGAPLAWGRAEAPEQQVFRMGAGKPELPRVLMEWTRALPPVSAGQQVFLILPTTWAPLLDQGGGLGPECKVLMANFGIPEIRSALKSSAKYSRLLLQVGPSAEPLERLSGFAELDEFRGVSWGAWRMLSLQTQASQAHPPAGSAWWAESGVSVAPHF